MLRKDLKIKFSVSFTESAGHVVLHCKGCLRFRVEAEVFAGATRRALESDRSLILDLSGLESIDSAGIGELVMVYMRACAAQREVSIAAPAKLVRELLELTNVASLFRTYPTVEEAKDALSREVA